jgi:hypothetical protein
MSNKIQRWFWRHGIIKCKHEWVPARQFYKEYEGKDYEFLEPSPMEHCPEYQSAAYVCRKCYESIVVAEKIGEPNKKLFIWR